ncbi:MAG: nucleotidyltransferase domain-containing protein [Nanoarchaeota archaeon]
MDRKKTIIKKLERFKGQIQNNIDVDKIIFFGSRVHGKPYKDSDIDLIIVSKDFREKKFRYRPIGFYDYWDLDYPVDFLCYTPEEFNKFKKQVTIVKEAVENGIEI